MAHSPQTLRTRQWLSLLTALLIGFALVPLSAAGSASAASGGDRAQPQGDRGTGWVRSTAARMTLKEKVGQLFMTYAYGETADTKAVDDVAANRKLYGVDNAQQLIDKYKLGGVIYFAWSHNTNNPQQIAELSNGVQRAALAQRMKVPALTAIDQEGGIVARVGPPATQFPGNMALGAGRSTDDARTAARITATELKAMGVNWNFAPVADVNVNPANPVIGVRSFGENPDLVASMTAAQVRGYQGAGIAAAGKHFPGHGDTATDSHTGLPVIDHSREEWEQLDKPPFQAAIDQGIKAIMTAHIVVPALDPSGDPATLSHPIITGILRDEMGYDGVVITDALTMEGVRTKYGDDRIPVLALKAGVDMLLMPADGKFDVAYNAVLDAVRKGELSEERIDESVRRILRLKWDLGLVKDPYVDESAVSSTVGTPEHLQAAQDLTDRTTTLVKNDHGLLPLKAGDDQSVLVTGWGASTTQTVADKIHQRGPSTDVLTTGASPTQEQIDAAAAAAETHDLTVVLTYSTQQPANASQHDLVNRLVATGKPVVAVAVRDPYDVRYFPQVPAYLATYGWQGVSLESLVRVLFGEVNPVGKLPVTIPTAKDPDTPLYEYGHGLGY